MKRFQKSNGYNAEKCEFFGLKGILHQLVLGLLIVSFLLLKRFLEKPRRHLWVWFFDVLKQIISSLILYSINIIFAYIVSNNNNYNSELCTIYFMNLFLGSIGGYYMSYFYISLFYYMKKTYKLHLYLNDVYYEEKIVDNKSTFQMKKRIYVYEIVFWTFIQLLWKYKLLIIFIFFKEIFISFGIICLKPFYNTQLKTFVILCLSPLLFNGIYHWKIDTLIKAKEKKLKLNYANISL